MRVIHFLEALKGGPASYLEALLPFQVAAYDHVAVLCPQAQAHFVRTPGVEIATFPDVTRTALGIAHMARYWRRRLTAGRYDVAHLHSSFAGAAGRLGSRRIADPKIVYCAHGWAFGMDIPRAQKTVYRLAERLLAQCADAIVNVSANEARLAANAGIPAARSMLIHNGIADSDWTPLPHGLHPSRLLFVGRYDRQKGIDVLLDAMDILSPLGFTLTTIGEPVVGRPAARRFPAHVRDLGWRTSEEIGAAMADADIVVMPSRWEGFGLVAAEAMQAGRPIVASAVGALPELVEDGRTGVLCPPDAPAALAEAIKTLAAMDVREMGLAARARYETLFTARRMFEGTDALYRGLTRGGQ